MAESPHLEIPLYLNLSQTTVMWNKFHNDLKNSTNVNMFKKRYKTFLVSEYAAT